MTGSHAPCVRAVVSVHVEGQGNGPPSSLSKLPTAALLLTFEVLSHCWLPLSCPPCTPAFHCLGQPGPREPRARLDMDPPGHALPDPHTPSLIGAHSSTSEPVPNHCASSPALPSRASGLSSPPERPAPAQVAPWSLASSSFHGFGLAVPPNPVTFI